MELSEEDQAIYDAAKRESQDPFSNTNAPKLSLIVQMRTYDALMAILHVLDEGQAQSLNSIHENGGVLFSLPFIDPKALFEDNE